jgi:hypothetical protein
MKILFILAAMITSVTFASETAEIAEQPQVAIKKVLPKEGEEVVDAENVQEDTQASQDA